MTCCFGWSEMVWRGMLAVALSAAGVARADTGIPPDATNLRPLAAISRKLDDEGVRLRAQFIDIGYVNASAGFEKGHGVNGGQFILGGDVDLGRLAGLNGAFLHIDETITSFRANETWNSRVGDNTVGYEPPYLFRTDYLSRLTIEQRLLDNRINIEVGRTNPIRYVNFPTCFNQLRTCWSDVWSFDDGGVPPTYATWGGRIRATIAGPWYMQAGVFEKNLTALTSSGWSDWNTKKATGVTAVAGVGYHSSEGSDLPGQYEFVIFRDTSDHPNPAVTVLGRSAAIYPGDPMLTGGGLTGLFMTAQQTIWRSASQHSTMLNLFGAAGGSPKRTAPVRAELVVGASIADFLPGHSGDSLTFKAHWSKLSAEEETYLADASRVAGGTGDRPKNPKLVIDLDAHFQLRQFMAIEPIVQYVINPNTYYNPYTDKKPSDGFVVGGAFTLNFGDILGLTARSGS